MERLELGERVEIIRGAQDAVLVVRRADGSVWEVNGWVMQTTDGLKRLEPRGYLARDYFRRGEYLGRDGDGIEPIWVRAEGEG